MSSGNTRCRWLDDNALEFLEHGRDAKLDEHLSRCSDCADLLPSVVDILVLLDLSGQAARFADYMRERSLDRPRAARRTRANTILANAPRVNGLYGSSRRRSWSR
jgi:hypothetical protein